MSSHARLSPSDSSRWLNCPGSINLCEKLKVKRLGNQFSSEGTFAHSIRETCLDLGIDAYHMIGFTDEVEGYEFTCDIDMADYLQYGIDRIRQFDGLMTVEYRVDLSRWMPGQFGTLDCGLAGKDEIVISDLKYGMGVLVNAVNNTQQMIYALGFWDNIAQHQTKATRFRIIIDQPRVASGGGEWIVELDELLAFGETLKAGAEATRNPDAPLCASASACQWCEAAKVENACPAYERWALDIIGSSFENLDEAQELGIPPTMPAPVLITPERRSFIVQHRQVFTRWLDRLHDDALQAALNGEPVPDLKAVAGRASPRKFRDAKVAEKLVREKIGTKGFKEVVLTPTQIEKNLGPSVYAEISEEVIRGDSKPQLVHLSDNRPALTPIIDKFDVLDDM